LSLFSTHNAVDHIWYKNLASPVKIATFSYDTSLIATTAQYDRMVKIWRRLSLADQRFEFDYLPHPAIVTGICWRRPFHRDQAFENVLYTFCEDCKLRIWSSGDSVSHHILQLWAEVDLMESIQPRTLDPADKSLKRFAFMIHSRDFTVATERAVQSSSKSENESFGLHHLIEVANRSPEICVVLDEKGNMSAWGIENVGSRNRVPGDIFNVAHVEGLKIRFDSMGPAFDENVQFLPFSSEKAENPFSVLVHHFDGRLEWYETTLDVLFDPSRRSNRFSLKAAWTGHSGEIKKVVRSVTGKAIISRTMQNESIVWRHRSSASGSSIHRSSIVDTEEHIHRAWVLQDGNFIVFLHHKSISLWDARNSRAVEVSRKSYHVEGKPLCLLYIPEVGHTGLIHLATISSEMKGVSWEVHLPSPDSTSDNATPTLEEFDRFDLSSEDNVDFVLSVDPAGTLPVLTGFLDTFARDIAISYTFDGKLTSWTVRPDLQRRKLEWLVTSTVETYIENPSLASGTSIRKAALVNSDKTQLTIWSTKGGSLEHEENFPESYGAIQDLDWSATPDNQSILSVGFPHKIIVYGQLRYDYIESRPSWAALREINALDFTPHPIGDSVWLGGGSFVIGAGNQLICLDSKLPVSESLQPDLRISPYQKAEVDIFTLVSRLNGPLPVYHPQYLAQFILGGKLMLVQKILLKLWDKLKFYTEGDPFDSMLGFSIEDFSNEPDLKSGVIRKELHSSYADFSEEGPETITEEVALSLNELLTTRIIPLLSSREQFLLADTVECVGTVEKHRRSMDENGCRYFLFFRQHVLRETQHAQESRIISWREITWAFHSKSQDILVDLVTRHYNGRLLWQNARESGMFMWMTDITALVGFSYLTYCFLLMLYSESAI
jgi:RAVE protein 1 C terminal